MPRLRSFLTRSGSVPSANNKRRSAMEWGDSSVWMPLSISRRFISTSLATLDVLTPVVSAPDGAFACCPYTEGVITSDASKTPTATECAAPRMLRLSPARRTGASPAPARLRVSRTKPAHPASFAKSAAPSAMRSRAISTPPRTRQISEWRSPTLTTTIPALRGVLANARAHAANATNPLRMSRLVIDPIMDRNRDGRERALPPP